MKNLIAVLTLVLIFTSAYGGSQPVRRNPASTTETPVNGQPITVERFVDIIEERAFRGCDRSASVLEGTDNPGRSGEGAGERRGSGEGQQ